MHAAKQGKSDVIKYLYGVIGKKCGYNSKIVHDFILINEVLICEMKQHI